MFSTIIRTTMALGVFAFAASAMQTTIWVSQASGDDGSLTPSDPDFPYATISRAVEVANGAGTAYIIKVVEGDYTQAHESGGGAQVPGYPISITNPSVRIEGASSTPANFPRLGGDVNVSDSSVRALFDIVADDVTLEDIRIQKLWFVAEDEASRDAPSAVRVEARGGGTAAVVVDGCVIERSAMNDSGNEDRAAILGVGGNGSLTFTVLACSIGSTVLAGVQMVVGDDCVSEATQSSQFVRVEGCTFVLEGTDASDAAIDVLYVVEGKQVVSTVNIIGCTIDSGGVTSGSAGFESGIRWGGIASGTEGSPGSATIAPGNSTIEENEITGCRDQAILFYGEQGSFGGVSIQTFDLGRNYIHDNAGDGLVVDGAGTEAYLRIQSHSNLIVRNRNAVVVQGTVDTFGELQFVHETWADNSQYGLFADDGSKITMIINCINYFNGYGAWDSPDGWEFVNVYNRVTNNWEGESGHFDPEFVDLQNGDFHLHEDSDCIGAGTNSFASVSIFGPDVFGGRRFVGLATDIGADEYDPEE